MTKGTKDTILVESFVRLRIAVGFLGEKPQYGWWDCSFLQPTGLKFLANVMPRTFHRAALRSTTDAACRVHDAAFSKIGTYHLFRLPEEIESKTRVTEEADATNQLAEEICSKEACLSQLNTLTKTPLTAPEGPTQIGRRNILFTEASVSEIASHYLSAFESGIHCYPYFGAD